ncbi:19963_t:CDS:1, partial [Rhizophagus irregularis]
GSPMDCSVTSSMNAILRKSPVTMSFFVVPLMSNVSSVPGTGSGVTVTLSPTTPGGKPGHG